MDLPVRRESMLWPIMAYCGASIMMTVVNKFVLSGASFNMNFLLLAIQSTVCAGTVASCKRSNLISVRDFSLPDVRAWWPVSAALVVTIYTGSKALQYLSIPLYTIFKNLTIILIAYAEMYTFGARVTSLTVVSFVLMVLSSLVAASTDFHQWLFGTEVAAAVGLISGQANVRLVDPVTGQHVVNGVKRAVEAHAGSMVGYGWMFLNCLAQASYVIVMKKKQATTKWKDWDSMFYNNLISIPILLVFSGLFENWSADNLDKNFPAGQKLFLLLLMGVSGGATVFISYSTAWCVRICGSTTYSMVGALNKLPVAASGLIFFGDPATLSSVSAIIIGFIAGLVYALAKNNQKKEEQSSQLPVYTQIQEKISAKE